MSLSAKTTPPSEPTASTDDLSSTTTSSPSPPPSPTAQPIGPFPRTFNIYLRGVCLPLAYTLGHTRKEPLFGVSIHIGVFSKPLLTLHAGPTRSTPALAQVHYAGVLGKHNRITLPGVPAPSESKRDVVEEELSNVWHARSVTHAFAIRVGDGVERFEWRGSHGEEVREMDSGSKWGFKLVRVDETVGEAVAGKSEGRERFVSSDGKEVVATCAYNGRLSMMVAKFAFVGSAAKGELGEGFAIMAVASILRALQMRIEGR